MTVFNQFLTTRHFCSKNKWLCNLKSLNSGRRPGADSCTRSFKSVVQELRIIY